MTLSKKSVLIQYDAAAATAARMQHNASFAALYLQVILLSSLSQKNLIKLFPATVQENRIIQYAAAAAARMQHYAAIAALY